MHASINAPRVKENSLDRFLYAPIREDANGLMITVASAIARQELDPWDEAAKWAQLARSSAIHRVTELIATLPSVRPVDESSVDAAKRLVTLLPRERGQVRTHGSEDDHESNRLRFTLIGLMVMLIIQWLIFRDVASDIPDDSAVTATAARVSASP
jgi:hypothetical protein